MQLKLRQLLLFLAACLILWFSKLPGGSLLAIASLLQMALLIYGFPFTKKNQIAFLKLFFYSLPALIFWGGTHSFIFIYLQDQSYYFAMMAASLSFCLSLIVAFQMIFAIEFLEKNNFELMASLQNAFNEIRNKKGHLLKIGSLVFIFSLVPYLSEEWKIVFALTATLFYLNPSKLKQAILKF